MVRLKVPPRKKKDLTYSVSIPYGSIKSSFEEYFVELQEIVSIPYGSIKSYTLFASYSNTFVSIPYGSIKRSWRRAFPMFSSAVSIPYGSIKSRGYTPDFW